MKRGKALFTNEQIEIANSISIIDYAETIGLELKKTQNGSYKVPSFGGLYIAPNGDRWHWVANYKSGGTIQFVMEIGKKTLDESIELLLSIAKKNAK